MKVEFTDKECLIYDQPILRGSIHRCVYTLDIPAGVAATAIRPNSIEDWHQRLGHLHYNAITERSKSDAVKGLKIVDPLTPSKTCEVCAMSKISRAPAPRRASRSISAQNEVCHGDLAGPFQRSYHGNRFYLSLKWRGHTTVYFLKQKSDATHCFQNYINIVNRRLKRLDRFKVYRSDNGGEFLAGDFIELCHSEGITAEMSEPEVHHQNGVIERTHRTIADAARALLLQAKLPHHLWEYAVRSAVYSRNRVLSRMDKEKPPFEKFWGRRPDMKLIKPFGQRCVVMIPPPEERSTQYKFRPKGRTGVFIGSDPQRKGYFVYVTGRGHKSIHSRSVVFLEPPSLQPVPDIISSRDDPLRIVEEDDEGEQNLSDYENSENDDRGEGDQRNNIGPPLSSTQVAEFNGNPDLTRVRRSERISSRNISAALSAAHVALREVINEPVNLREARASKQWLLWEKAIREEIAALRANDTFELVDPPPGAHVIGSTFVFRIKLNGSGEVDRLKARICAQGFTQEFLKDYYETYVPVAKLNSIRTFLAMAT
ncbi:unnamed protein product [Phytophthora fragariaefolia]|uniref:Unnamed protein product n=1 Tax=Phytophthora fragariaefolia TaxID=1490495 RepID=A0A9W6UF43_9STRA|nr:unnamed protein product [Phytophthora fragariaefolia]